jgi:hypothetical protein
VTKRLFLLIWILALVVPGVARADVSIAEGDATLGYVHLVATASPAVDDLRIVEEIDGTEVGLAEGTSTDTLETHSPWSCRSSRVFEAVAGDQRSAPITVTTPACADRLKLVAPKHVGLGGDMRVTVFDRWHLGNLAADLCAVRPDAKRTCTHIAMPAYQYIAHGVFRASGAGEWQVSVTDPTQTTSAPVIVVREHYPAGRPTVLATGDSMMLSTTTALRHRLSGLARTVDDVYVGSGISRPFVIDWSKLPGTQVRAYHPDATVI